MDVGIDDDVDVDVVGLAGGVVCATTDAIMASPERTRLRGEGSGVDGDVDVVM